MQETEHQIERREDRIELGRLIESVGGLKNDIKELREDWHRDIDKLETKLDIAGKSFITRVEFLPVKSIAYGLVAICGLSILTAVIKLVVMK